MTYPSRRAAVCHPSNVGAVAVGAASDCSVSHGTIEPAADNNAVSDESVTVAERTQRYCTHVKKPYPSTMPGAAGCSIARMNPSSAMRNGTMLLTSSPPAVLPSLPLLVLFGRSHSPRLRMSCPTRAIWRQVAICLAVGETVI